MHAYSRCMRAYAGVCAMPCACDHFRPSQLFPGSRWHQYGVFWAPCKPKIHRKDEEGKKCKAKLKFRAEIAHFCLVGPNRALVICF